MLLFQNLFHKNLEMRLLPKLILLEVERANYMTTNYEG